MSNQKILLIIYKMRTRQPKDFLASYSEVKDYIFEQILGHRVYYGIKYYLVKWKDFPVEDSTWEPIQNLIQVIQAVLCYDYFQYKASKLSQKEVQLSQVRDIKKAFCHHYEHLDKDNIVYKFKFARIERIEISFCQELKRMKKEFQAKERKKIILATLASYQQKYSENHDILIVDHEIVEKEEVQVAYFKINKCYFYIIEGEIKVLSGQKKLKAKRSSIGLKVIIKVSKDQSIQNQEGKFCYQSGNQVISLLNRPEMVKSRILCTKTLVYALFSPSEKNALNIIMCHSSDFRAFTLRFLKTDQKAITYFLIDKICIQQEHQTLKQGYESVDLQAMLVYHPKELWDYLHRQRTGLQ